MDIQHLPTPAILVDRAKLMANLEAMQQRADGQGVRLRPHTKTHKSIALAKLQRDLGATGLTVAKLGEAETFVEAGFDDIRIAYALVGDDKYDRVRQLMDRARITFCIDTVEGASAASRFFSASGLEAEVLIETDIGYGRCGVRYDDPRSATFARWVDDQPGLRVVGILTHAGHSYGGPKEEGESKERALRRVSIEERDRMLDFAVALKDVGVASAVDGSLEISIGSTPSLRYFRNRTHLGFSVTEIRPGNYVYLDMTQVNLGVEPLERCALTVLATVISKHINQDGTERLFLDSGKKVLTSDSAYGQEGYGQVLQGLHTMMPLKGAVINALSEEHGWVRAPGGTALSVLERARVVPNHACVVVNTQKHVHVVEGDHVVDTWLVDAQSLVL